MAKTKQAPLPWTLTKNSWQYTTIYDAEGNSICRLDLEDWSVTESNQDGLEKVQTQTAERIVKAVNYHDALVRALELQMAAETAHLKCDECEGQEIPELCPKCFPLYDDARLARMKALSAVVGGRQQP